MASTIQSQTIGGVGDLCIALAASQFGRAHGYGDNWNTLRVALLYSVEDTGAALAGTVLRIGLCNGTAAMPGDATTNNSYGMKMASSWIWTGTAPNKFYSEGGAGYASSFSRVGSTETTGATTIAPYIGMVGVNRACFFMDVIKGSPNYTFKIFYRNVSTSPADVTPANYLAQVPSLAPALTGHIYSGAVGSLAIDTGTNGILDTVYVGWNLLTPRIFISNLAVVKLA